ncbi:MAG: hypothetical protein IPN36_08800 [Bacteroidetes bacterium]|nr:hypothetical protein [Bacteroidota bacterium]
MHSNCKSCGRRSLKVWEGSVRIGRKCWLGNGVVITAGVTLGDNVVVGANAVVTKSFPSNVVIGGVPARILKEVGNGSL